MRLCRRQQLICRCVGRAACCVLGCRAAVRFYATAALGRRAPSNAAARRCQSQVPPPLNPQDTSQINPTCSHRLAHVVPEPLHPLLPLLALSQEDINQYKGAAGAQAAGGVRQKARLALLAARQAGGEGRGVRELVNCCSSQGGHWSAAAFHNSCCLKRRCKQAPRPAALHCHGCATSSHTAGSRYPHLRWCTAKEAKIRSNWPAGQASTNVVMSCCAQGSEGGGGAEPA